MKRILFVLRRTMPLSLSVQCAARSLVVPVSHLPWYSLRPQEHFCVCRNAQVCAVALLVSLPSSLRKHRVALQLYKLCAFWRTVNTLQLFSNAAADLALSPWCWRCCCLVLSVCRTDIANKFASLEPTRYNSRDDDGN